MTEATSNSKWICGFWRRIGALIIDGVLVGLIGFALTIGFKEQLVEIGAWGRLLGFLIALPYYGVMNSVVCKGQTLGKRLLKIRVVDAGNRPISIGRSLIRYGVYSAPFFLNNAQFPIEVLLGPPMFLLAFLIFGVGLSSIYLYLFNRNTRQSLHDLVVGTYVVNADEQEQVTGPVWRVHLGVVAALMLLAIIVPIYTSTLLETQPFSELLKVQRAVAENDAVAHVQISVGKSVVGIGADEKKESTFIDARVFLREDRIGDEALAKEIAKNIVENFDGARDKGVIVIALVYGYDIGIWSMWKRHSYQFNPQPSGDEAVALQST